MKRAFGDRAEVTILDSWEDAEHFKEKVGSHYGSGTTLIIERIHLQKFGHINIGTIVMARH